ncbi:hypothetical protein H4I96_07092 [Botrytis cinerea]
MASKSNPNVPQKKRKVANRAKTQRKNAINKITKTQEAPEPKARKVQKAQNCARQRALEQAMKEGDVNMTEAAETIFKAANEGMEVDRVA